jgi:hypothetical protein
MGIGRDVPREAVLDANRRPLPSRERDGEPVATTRVEALPRCWKGAVSGSRSAGVGAGPPARRPGSACHAYQRKAGLSVTAPQGARQH